MLTHLLTHSLENALSEWKKLHYNFHYYNCNNLLLVLFKAFCYLLVSAVAATAVAVVVAACNIVISQMLIDALPSTAARNELPNITCYSNSMTFSKEFG